MKPFVGMLDRLAATKPEKVAVIYGDQSVSYSQLSAWSRHAAASLRRLGIRENDRLAIWLPNVPAFVVLLFACMRIGAVAVTINTRFRAAEIGDIIDRTGASALAFWPGFKGLPFVETLAAIDPAALQRLGCTIVYDEGEANAGPIPIANARAVRYIDLLMAGKADLAESAAEGGVTFTTSGTTGASKFVRHSQAGSSAHGSAMSRAFGYALPEARVVIANPLCGIFGYSEFVGVMAAGASMVLLPSMDADAIVAALRSGATHIDGTDTLIRRILSSVDGERPFPKLMPSVFAPFEFPAADTAALAESRGLTLLGAYGMTEIFSMFATQRLGMSLVERAKGGGYPIANDAEVRVRDPDSGAILGPGLRGEFEIRSRSLMVEYLGNAAATAAAFTADGFFRTGDIGIVEEDGRLLFEARNIEMARLGGFLVNPMEIESQLLRLPGVAYAQVVVAQTGVGNRAVGFVIMNAGARFDEASMRENCRSALAPYKVPARIVAVSVFPTTEGVNGSKVQRGKLREMAAVLLAA